jgi:glycerol-3-phosphate acyltransferase PlsY
MELVLLGILAYLLGSIPNAVWVGKSFYNIDIREHGSGNAGATNVFRVLGKGPGVAVLLADMMKGVLAASLVYVQHRYNSDSGYVWVNLKLIYGGLAVLGHLYPVFANFRGGKGIATLFGMIIVIHYFSALACAGIFLIILFSTRYVSLSSILAAISFPVLVTVVFHKDNPYFIAFGICAAVTVILTHRKNITRLIARTESKANILPSHRRK